MEVGVQNGGLIDNWSVEDTYRMIAEAGFKSVDWNINRAWDKNMVRAKKLEHCIFEDSLEEIEAYYKEEIDAMRKYGLTPIQAHAPFPAYVPDFPEFNEYAINVYKQCIRFCDKVGVKYLVIHGISLAMNDYTQTPESIEAMNDHLYESLIPVLRETNVVVCLENLFTRYKDVFVVGHCSDARQAVEAIDRYNAKAGKECFGLCLDTGHLNLLGIRPDNYIRTLGSRIKALHTHDNSGNSDAHLAPYTGTIIWKDLIQALKEVGYSGDIGFETFQQVSLARVDREVVTSWLKLIYEIGDSFRKKIEG